MIDSRGALLPVADLKHRLQELQEAFEYVLIDAPAAGILPDAAILVSSPMLLFSSSRPTAHAE